MLTRTRGKMRLDTRDTDRTLRHNHGMPSRDQVKDVTVLLFGSSNFLLQLRTNMAFYSDYHI